MMERKKKTTESVLARNTILLEKIIQNRKHEINSGKLQTEIYAMRCDVCNWKPNIFIICARVHFELSANDFVEDVEESATITAAAAKTQIHLTSFKNMMNTHTIKIIYQFRVLIQFIFCAFRNRR